VHQHVPRPVDPPASSGSDLGAGANSLQAGQRRRCRLVRQLLVTGVAALLGFENEAISLVEIDTFAGCGAVAARLLDHALEDILIGFTIARSRFGTLYVQNIAKLGEKQRIIRSFLSTF
jgi:hypothetical protein